MPKQSLASRRSNLTKNEECKEAGERKLTGEVLALAEKRRAAAPLLVANRQMGITLVFLGEIAEGRKHLDQVITLYDPGKHRVLTAQKFRTDVRAHTLCYQSCAFP
jgi:hypothetical protein